MEPIHYLRALRRRWWVIALSVVVAGTAAFLTTAEAVSSGLGTPSAPAGTEYTATTILWNPGAPIVGTGTPITSMDTLAQLVRLADVTAIAAKKLGADEDPIELSTKVSAVADPVTGFLSVTGRADDPKRAEAISTAFSQALITYLGELKITQIDQRQRLVQEQIKALQEQSGDPTVIATLQTALAQLEIDRTAPISLTAIQRPSAEPVAAQPGGFQAPESRTSRVLLASLFGLLAGIALALVLERFDTRIRSTPSAEDAFGLPVLAEIPSIRRGRRDGVVTESHPLSRAAGAFRLLQVGVQRWASDTDAAAASMILVTSPEARDGKTTVAANLATAFAQAGKRVLVVSADLRRPALHSAFDVSLEPGLTDAVRAMNGSGSAATLDLGTYLEPCAVVRLAVLPSGMIPDHPAELLGSEKMRRLIERLKQLTDVVILDAAPLVVASDVVPLVPEADGVLLVARAGKTRREIAASAASLIERVGAKKVGVVMNDAREFSIPLAKRGMYQPTRKMRKAAERRRRPTADEPRSTQPAQREQSSREPRIDEPTTVEPTTVEEPTAVDENTAAEAPIVVEEPADASRGQMRSSMSKAQQELRDLRAQLEGFTVDLPAEGVAGIE